MQFIELNGVGLHFQDEGPKDGPPIVFSNSLGTDLRLWDPILPHIPQSLRVIRYDKRGHGLSECPPAPYSMGALVSDVEALMDHLKIKNAAFVGCSVGGLIGQGLAVKRLDLVRALVLTNTAAKIGTTEMWDDRISAVNEGGIEALSEAILERWFSKDFLASPQLETWRNLLVRQPDEGYAGVSAAISGTDFFPTTATLTLPTLAIAGSEDGATPPDLVRETAGLIRGSSFELIRGAGHLPMVERPKEFADLLTAFLKFVGHI